MLVARTLGLGEEIGQGVDRMYRVMISAGRDLPTIRGEHDHVAVAFRGGEPDRRFARFVAESLPEDVRLDLSSLLVLRTLCQRRTVDAKAVSIVIQQPVDVSEDAIRRLSRPDLALLEPTRGTVRRRYPLYRFTGETLAALGSAIEYHRAPTAEIDRKIAAHTREYGRITNLTVRNMFDVDVERASAIRADAVERGLLQKSRTGERGPGVEYVLVPRSGRTT